MKPLSHKTGCRIFLSIFTLTFFSAVLANAQSERPWLTNEGKVTPTEVYNMVVQGANVLETLGEDGLQAFNDPHGEFVLKNAWTIVTDCSTDKIVAHPIPQLIGLDSTLLKDHKTGKLILSEFCENVNPKGLWTEYWWTHPKTKIIGRILAFGIPVEGTSYQVIATFRNEDIKIEDLRVE